MNNRIFLDLHIIQTLPPSNINRDDTGSPKTALYGGVRRARVSSQSWKRAIRNYFKENLQFEKKGIRTKYIIKLVADKIKVYFSSLDDETAHDLAKKYFKEATKFKEKEITIDNEGKLETLFFISEKQVDDLAKAIFYLENNKNVSKESLKKEKDNLKEILKANNSIDIALFGRMLAFNSGFNEDASCQVSHAISTHAIQNEFDFFTAIDDLAPEDNSGAGMLGNIEYNSSTLYRYANIAVHELNSQLKDNEVVINAVKLFVESFSNSLPTGKVNTFANQTLPQVLIVTLRNDRPISLVTAFEKPIKSNDGNVEKSIVELAKEFEKVEKFVNKPLYSTYLTLEEVKELREIGEEKNSLKDLLDDLSEKLNEYLKGE